MPRTHTPAAPQNVGALVFLFAQSDGQYGIVSYDRKVEAWGRSLDAIWPKYFTKARRQMAKHEREEAAKAKSAPAVVVASDLPDAVRERRVY